MIFSTFFSSLFSDLKSSLHASYLSNSLITLTKSFQSKQVDQKPVIARIFEGYSSTVSNCIKPVPALLENKLIHTRLKTEHERIIDMQKELEQTKSEIQLVRYLRKRQKKTTGIAEKNFARERDMLMTEYAREFQNLTEKIQHWQVIANEHEEKISKMGQDVLALTDAAATSAGNVETLKADRDETRAQLDREKKLAEETKRKCSETVSTIREKLEHEKELLQGRAHALREKSRIKDRKIAELNDLCEGSMREMEGKDSQIALHESNEVIDSYCRGISGIVGEMSEVVEIFGLNDYQNLGEKMQILLNGMRGLASEVKRLRGHSHAAALRMYLLKQERFRWEQFGTPPFDLESYKDFATEFGDMSGERERTK